MNKYAPRTTEVSKGTQYAVDLFIDGSHVMTEYINNRETENFDRRLKNLYSHKGYDWEYYSFGEYLSCDECGFTNYHEVITQKQMAYGRQKEMTNE